MRKLASLLILLLLGAAGMAYFGGPIQIPLGEWTGGVPDQGAAYEINARGVQELAEGNVDKAVDTLREAVRLEPGNSIVARNLSLALARQARNPDTDTVRALELLEESLRLWPRNPEGLDGMTALHFKAARYEEALRYAVVLREILPHREDLAQYVLNLEGRVAAEKGMSAEQGDHFRLLYGSDRKLAYEGEILSLLQTQMDSLTAALGIFPDRAIDVLILTDDMGPGADPADPLLQGLYDGQIRLYAGQEIDEDREALVRTVRHEMVHALLHRAAGELPGWVQEGLAQKVGEDPDAERLRGVRSYLSQAVGRGYRVDLFTLDRTFLGMDSEDRSLAYAVSLVFMDHLSRTYGDTFIPRFVGEITTGVPPAQALEILTGRNMAQLQSALDRALREGS